MYSAVINQLIFQSCLTPGPGAKIGKDWQRHSQPQIRRTPRRFRTLFVDMFFLFNIWSPENHQHWLIYFKLALKFS